jgi:hypothetical protein
MGCREPAVGALLLRESLILGGPLEEFEEVPATEVWPLGTRENVLSDSVGTTGSTGTQNKETEPIKCH